MEFSISVILKILRISVFWVLKQGVLEDTIFHRSLFHHFCIFNSCFSLIFFKASGALKLYWQCAFGSTRSVPSYHLSFSLLLCTYWTCCSRLTELYCIEVARFKMLSLPWFDSYVNLYWYFYSHLEFGCWYFLKCKQLSYSYSWNKEKKFKVWLSNTSKI